jgi:hypothetical protein
MSPETHYETQRIDHLGIVAGISRKIGLIETIDEKVGKAERKVSCGEGVLAMVLNALGFSSRALYLMPDYLRNKPVDLLIRPELTADDFNDDTLGRCLDDLYASGVTEVFASVATKALSVYGIEHQFVHLDSSSFHLHGQYDTDAPGEEMVRSRVKISSALYKPISATNADRTWMQRVIPNGASCMSLKVQTLHDLIRDLDSSLIGLLHQEGSYL